MPETRWRYLCRIADWVAAVEGSDPLLRELAQELYSGARTHGGTPVTRLALELREDQFLLRQDGVERCRTADLSALFQEAEWALTVSAMAALDRFYQVHAGAVVRGGQAWLLVGPPDSGKTSLVLALARRGAAVLTDEVGLVEPARLRVAPFRRDLIVCPGTWSLFPELADLVRLPPYKTAAEGWYLSPRLVGGQDLTGPADLVRLLFPQRLPEGGTTLQPLGQAEVARRLLEQSFNLDRWGGEGVEAIGRLVEQCPAWTVAFADAREAAARLLASEPVGFF